MENGLIYQDFLREYQLLLENEKRRLNFVSEKCNNVTEGVGGHISSTAAVDETSHVSVEDNKSSEIEKLVVKEQQVVHECPKDATSTHDNNKRTEMMEQWVTDSFYTSFPSFKKQDQNGNRLADDRREDYRKYLDEVSNKKLLDAARGSRSRRTEAYSDSELMFAKSPETPRDKLLFDLKHSELAYNIHNPNAIDDRNQKVAMERARRKVELQQELIKQIEEKKLQIEKIRAKEKEDEEILQRRLDNQMKALHMADELRKMSNEKMLISNPTHQTVRRRDIESHIDELKAENVSRAPENQHRNNVEVNADRKIYKFFSNSAPHNDGHLNYYNQPVGYNNMAITNPYLHHISTAAHNPTQHCNRCRRVMPILCSSCCHNDLNPSYFCCYQCNLLQNTDACNSCQRAWMPPWNHYGDVERGGRLNIHRRGDNRPQILEITYQDHSSQTNGSTALLSKSDSNLEIRSDSPDTSSDFASHKPQKKNHPAMTHSDKMVGIGTTFLPNIPESVSLSKEQEMLELKRRNDMLIAKYAQNYGSLRNRKSVAKQTTSSQHTNDSFPLPLMREHLATTTTSSSKVPDTRRVNSQAVRKLEDKWEIPVVQRQVITNKPAQVLTQVGAIARQLQLEKLNFSDDL